MGSQAMRCAVIVAVLALAGCQGVGLTSSFCDARSGLRPIRLTATERAALATVVKRDILAVNEYGARNCGWSAKGK